MLIDLSSVQARASRLVGVGQELFELGLERRARSLARAAEHLRALGAEPAVLARLAESSGLSVEMTRWALESTLETVDATTLLGVGRAALELHPTLRPVPARLCAIVLSGNVLTAPVRAMLLPLLVGVPVLAKASTREDVLPKLLLDSLEETDPALGAACDVITLQGDSPSTGALFDQADAISVYGSDATVRAVRAAAPATSEVIAHGHGIGVAYVDGVPTSADELDAVARPLGEDVAAYDQRGCLSPHAIFVRGPEEDAKRLARAVHEALAALAIERPRGRLPLSSASAQLQWRGVAAARGELHEGDGFAVSYEGEHSLRISPGYRNVAVHRCAGVDALVDALCPFGVHLKALGVGGAAVRAREVAKALEAPLAPTLCALGAMQRPRFGALADGHPPAYGLVRFVETDLAAR